MNRILEPPHIVEVLGTLHEVIHKLSDREFLS
jgi:hypothetical protein